MPERVGDYYNLMPLDSNQANVPHKSRTFRYQTISYKATHQRCRIFQKMKNFPPRENFFEKFPQAVLSWSLTDQLYLKNIVQIVWTFDFIEHNI